MRDDVTTGLLDVGYITGQLLVSDGGLTALR